MEAATTPQNYAPARYVQFEDKEEAGKAAEQSAAAYGGNIMESSAGKYLAVTAGDNLLLVARWGEITLN